MLNLGGNELRYRTGSIGNMCPVCFAEYLGAFERGPKGIRIIGAKDRVDAGGGHSVYRIYHLPSFRI